MQRYNLILQHSEYQRCMIQNEKADNMRNFCRHDLQHALDVARISYIIVLENKLKIPKDIVYAAAFLHDIGKFQQIFYEKPHHQESAKIAQKILKDCNYEEEEIQIILQAILTHRKQMGLEKQNFLSVLYQADKLSRRCYECKAILECNWKEETKNKQIIY